MKISNKFIVVFLLAQAFINYNYAYGFTCALLIICVALILCQQFIYTPWAIKANAGISRYKIDAEREIKALKHDLEISKKETEYYQRIQKQTLGQCTPQEYQKARDEFFNDSKNKKNGK